MISPKSEVGQFCEGLSFFSVFSGHCMGMNSLYLHFQVGKQCTALYGHGPVSFCQASCFAWHLGKNCRTRNKCVNVEMVTS